MGLGDNNKKKNQKKKTKKLATRNEREVITSHRKKSIKNEKRKT